MNPAWCNARRHVARGCCSKAKCYRHGPNMRFQWMGFAKQTETWKPLKTVQNLCRKKKRSISVVPQKSARLPKKYIERHLGHFFCIKRRSRSMYLCTYVPMYLCIYVSMYLCIYVSMYIYIYTHLYVYVYVNVYVYVYAYIYIYIYTYTHLYVQYMYMYMYMFMCIYVYIYIYIYCMYYRGCFYEKNLHPGNFT